MIRKAIEQDIPRLLELLHQVNKVHHTLRPDLFKPQTTKYDELQLLQILADESKAIFVYEETSVLGYAFVQIEETKGDRLLQDRCTLYVDDLCVDEMARNRHIGRQLFDHVRAYARSQGCDSMTLNVWDGNQAAWTFYQCLGMHVRKTCMEMNLDTLSTRPVQQTHTKTKADSRVQKLVMVVGKQSLPRKQIMADLGLMQTSRQAFIDHYWRPAWEQGLVDLAHPNSPNKPEQTYRLTANGLDLYNDLMQNYDLKQPSISSDGLSISVTTDK